MTDNDAKLTVELGETAVYACSCCGKNSETVHGFLYDEHGATTVYFAGYTHGHKERRVNFALSIGAWGDGGTPDDRKSIALEILPVSDDQMTYEFPPVETSPWYGETFLGQMVPPDELSPDDRRHYQALARIVVEQDPRIADYLKKAPPGSHDDAE